MKEVNSMVFFWGKDDPFSNFYYTPFKHKNILFKWSEQAVMYEKAMLFGSIQVAKEILRAPTPQACKQLGRSRKIAFNQDVWDEQKETVYFNVLLSKFSNPKLKKVLLETNDKLLAEASPYDKIWGIGYAWDHPNALYPDRWKGQNLLGKVLMDVRETLKVNAEGNVE